MSVTDRIVNYLKNGDFASANLADYYQMTTGAAIMDMEGWSTTGNMVLRGKGTETYGIMAGWRYIIPVLADLRYDDAFVDWGRSLTNSLGQPSFTKEYIESLRGKPLPITIDAIPDGSVIFPGPLANISGPALATKWVDTSINDPTRRGISIATKISRLLWASAGKVKLADNSMRRSADILGLMVGDLCNAMGLPTSNMAVAQANGTPPAGTMDHWYIALKVAQYYDSNLDADPNDRASRIAALVHAYRSFVLANPADGALLLDLSSLDEGLEAAIIVLKEFNPPNYSVRNDSGNLGTSANYIRAQLDNAGLDKVRILLSGGLRSINIFNLVKEERPFAGAGIGEYFQPHAEVKEKGVKEERVNTEIVTKLGALVSPLGRGYNSIKISDTPAKASRGGKLDLWILTDREANGQKAYIEVDANRSGHLLKDGHLTGPLTSVRTANGKRRTYPAGTEVFRPMVRLLDKGRYVGEEALSNASFRRNFEWGMNTLPEDLKQIDGQHSSTPTGVEREHFRINRDMAEDGVIIERL